MKDKLKNRLGMAMVGISTMAMTGISACAEESATTTAMTTALNGVKSDSLGAISAVAPIGIAIMGAFLVWKYGMRFFKSISK